MDLAMYRVRLSKDLMWEVDADSKEEAVYKIKKLAAKLIHMPASHNNDYLYTRNIYARVLATPVLEVELI